MEKQQPLFPPNKSQLEKLSDLHKAMGDRTRMEILWKLMKHQYCVSALARRSTAYRIRCIPSTGVF